MSVFVFNVLLQNWFWGHPRQPKRSQIVVVVVVVQVVEWQHSGPTAWFESCWGFGPIMSDKPASLSSIILSYHHFNIVNHQL